MYQQYYYMLLYLLRELVGAMAALWWWYVRKIHAFPEFAITVMLFGMLTLIVMALKRNVRVTQVKGDEIRQLVKVLRGEK